MKDFCERMFLNLCQLLHRRLFPFRGNNPIDIFFVLVHQPLAVEIPVSVANSKRKFSENVLEYEDIASQNKNGRLLFDRL